LIIEVVDTEEHVKRLEPILDEMVADGLVTLEKVRAAVQARRAAQIAQGVALSGREHGTALPGASPAAPRFGSSYRHCGSVDRAPPSDE
jgi:uncharacterized protein DUF190